MTVNSLRNCEWGKGLHVAALEMNMELVISVSFFKAGGQIPSLEQKNEEEVHTLTCRPCYRNTQSQKMGPLVARCKSIVRNGGAWHGGAIAVVLSHSPSLYCCCLEELRVRSCQTRAVQPLFLNSLLAACPANLQVWPKLGYLAPLL